MHSDPPEVVSFLSVFKDRHNIIKWVILFTIFYIDVQVSPQSHHEVPHTAGMMNGVSVWMVTLNTNVISNWFSVQYLSNTKRACRLRLGGIIISNSFEHHFYLCIVWTTRFISTNLASVSYLFTVLKFIFCYFLLP